MLTDFSIQAIRATLIKSLSMPTFDSRVEICLFSRTLLIVQSFFKAFICCKFFKC